MIQRHTIFYENAHHTAWADAVTYFDSTGKRRRLPKYNNPDYDPWIREMMHAP